MVVVTEKLAPKIPSGTSVAFFQPDITIPEGNGELDLGELIIPERTPKTILDGIEKRGP
jgi:hypothetical protein